MKDRVRNLRKNLRLSQEQFGEIIGITNTAVSKIENGENNLTDQNIKALCREFNVNENWLRTGTGEMFVQLARDEEIAAFVGHLLSDEKDTFKKRLVSVLSKLNESDWEALEKVLTKLVDSTKKD